MSVVVAEGDVHKELLWGDETIIAYFSRESKGEEGAGFWREVPFEASRITLNFPTVFAVWVLTLREESKETYGFVAHDFP